MVIRIRKKVLGITAIIVIILIFMYVTMLFDTNSLMVEVKEVFMWKVDRAETDGRAISMYNDSDRAANVDLGYVSLRLVRLFTLHNFRSGYIWAVYSYAAYDTQGEIITASWNVRTKWYIQKIDGRWEIIEIIEPP
jgi:hypothetical protein